MIIEVSYNRAIVAVPIPAVSSVSIVMETESHVLLVADPIETFVVAIEVVIMHNMTKVVVHISFIIVFFIPSYVKSFLLLI